MVITMNSQVTKKMSAVAGKKTNDDDDSMSSASTTMSLDDTSKDKNATGNQDKTSGGRQGHSTSVEYSTNRHCCNY